MSFSELNNILESDLIDVKQDLEKPTVLIIDDERALLDTLEYSLKDIYNTILCESGEEGLSAFNDKVQIVILDLKMKGKDGFETFTELKQKNPDIPIVFHSAYQDLKDPYELLNDYKPFAYISKGSSSDKLLHTIASGIGHFQEIQKNKILVEKLKKLNEELEEKVKKRTEELSKANQKLNKTLASIKRDLNLAQKIQRSMLPKESLEYNGIKVYIKYLPLHKIGGDYYDIFEYKPGVYRIFLADATGHGIQAALITMAIKGEYESLKSIINKADELLFLLNNLYIEKFHSINFFFTCILVDIDVNNGEIQYSAAGHPDQFIIQNGNSKILSLRSRLAGYKKEEKYPMKETSFLKGDRLILYSDGLYEQFNAKGESFDERRLFESLTKISNTKQAPIAENVLKDIEVFIGEQQPLNDDITIIEIERG